MNAHDETRTLRRRLTGVEQALAAQGEPDRQGSVALVGLTTTVDSYPTVEVAYYAMRPIRLGGPIGEGMTPELHTGTKVFYALNLGAMIPPPSTYVVVAGVGGRFTFRYG